VVDLLAFNFRFKITIALRFKITHCWSTIAHLLPDAIYTFLLPQFLYKQMVVARDSEVTSSGLTERKSKIFFHQSVQVIVTSS